MDVEGKRPVVLIDSLADTEAAMAILRRLIRLAEFMRIEVSQEGASATLSFSGRIVDITDAEAELLTRLRGE